MRAASRGLSVVIGLAAALVASGAAAQTFHGSGTVSGVLVRAQRLVVDAGEIPGYMAAMEMVYRVEPASLLDGLKRGDKIEFDVDGKTATITGIKVVGAGR